MEHKDFLSTWCMIFVELVELRWKNLLRTKNSLDERFSIKAVC